MAFQFCDSMINDYLSQGYLVLRGIVPPSLLRDLRVEADKARDLAHQLNGPQTQRIQLHVSRFTPAAGKKGIETRKLEGNRACFKLPQKCVDTVS